MKDMTNGHGVLRTIGGKLIGANSLASRQDVFALSVAGHLHARNVESSIGCAIGARIGELRMTVPVESATGRKWINQQWG
jgi:hypothetical protein